MKKVLPLIIVGFIIVGFSNSATASTEKLVPPFSNWSWEEDYSFSSQYWNWEEMRAFCYSMMSSFWNNSAEQFNNFNEPTPGENSNTGFTDAQNTNPSPMYNQNISPNPINEPNQNYNYRTRRNCMGW